MSLKITETIRAYTPDPFRGEYFIFFSIIITDNIKEF